MAIDLFAKSAQNLSWRGQALGCFCLVIIVLFTWLPYSYYEMVALPGIVVWQVGFIALGIWGIWLLRQFELPFRCLGWGFDWVVGSGAISLIISAIFAQFTQVSVSYVIVAAYYGLLLYVLHNWLGTGWLTVSRLWVGLVLVGIVAGGISFGAAIYQLGVNGQLDFNSMPLGHRNFVAGYLLLVLPITVSLALTKKGWQKFVLVAASVMLAVDLYTTQSRGGMLGILIVALTCLGFWIKHNSSKNKLLIILASFCASAILLTVILSSYRVEQIVKVSVAPDRLPSLQFNLDGPSEDRLFMIQTAWNIFRDRPFVGVGAGNISRVYNLYRPIEVGTGASHVQQLHNTPLNILAELGILGIATYLMLLGCWWRLWSNLKQKLIEPSDRFLRYGIGASLLGYTVSSLTDYQLENIGIGSTIIILTVLLIGLADSPNSELSYSNRRWTSLGIASLLISSSLLWISVDSALFLTKAGYQDLVSGKVTKFYEKLTTAANLVPWDPTYPQILGLQLWNTRSVVKDNSAANNLTDLATNNLKRAVKTAPHDTWFNHNLGMVYRDRNPQAAEKYFSRAVQLQPRDRNYYDYFYLGNTYLKQQKNQLAISAFTLQGLVTPEYLTFDVWNQPSLSSLHDFIGKKTIETLELLLASLDRNEPNYRIVFEKIALLKWWFELPLDNVNLDYLRPIIKSLIVAEKSPEQAISILNLGLQQNPNDLACLLLRAWLKPEQYLQDYLERDRQTEAEIIVKLIHKYRDLRDWLTSMQIGLEDNDRVMSILVYRNAYFSQEKSILLGQEIKPNYLIGRLNLFSEWGRTFSELDRLLEKLKDRELNLVHPTKNGFKLLPDL